MPTHGILITFKDFPNVEAVKGYWMGHGKNKPELTVAYFEKIGVAEKLSKLQQAVRTANQAKAKLKIFVQGHGLAWRDFITSHWGNAQSQPPPDQTRNIAQLAALLADILSVCDPKTDPDNAGNTVIVMLACTFGRSLTSDLKGSNAWKLHDALRQKGVFVELVARTEFVSPSPFGLGIKVNTSPTARGQDNLKFVKISGKEELAGRFQPSPERKVPYTKVVCKYVDREPVIRMLDYEEEGWGKRPSKIERNPADPMVKRVAWLHYALEQVSLHAAENKNKTVIDAVGAYMDLVEVGELRASSYDPAYLYKLLRYLVGDEPKKPLPEGYTYTPPAPKSRSSYGSSFSPLFGGGEQPGAPKEVVYPPVLSQIEPITVSAATGAVTDLLRIIIGKYPG